MGSCSPYYKLMSCCSNMATGRVTPRLPAIFYHIRHSLLLPVTLLYLPALTSTSHLKSSIPPSHLPFLTTFSYPPLTLHLSSILQDISPGLLLSCWSHTISSSLAGTYDHRQSTAGVVGLLAHAMLINKSQVRTCLHFFYCYLSPVVTPHSACKYCPYPPHS
jgi:hypothetical protein